MGGYVTGGHVTSWQWLTVVSSWSQSSSFPSPLLGFFDSFDFWSASSRGSSSLGSWIASLLSEGASSAVSISPAATSSSTEISFLTPVSDPAATSLSLSFFFRIGLYAKTNSAKWDINCVRGQLQITINASIDYPLYRLFLYTQTFYFAHFPKMNSFMLITLLVFPSWELQS